MEGEHFVCGMINQRIECVPKDTNHSISTKQHPCKLESCEPMSIIK